jgi:DNA-binding NtrC family response regulator
MVNELMGLVLWIDSNTFASSLLEKVFKKKGLDFYTIPHARDFLYLVEDLKPSVIVIDSLTVKQDLEVFRNQYESSEILRNTPVVVIGGWAGLEFIQEKKGEMPRTFDPFTVPETLKAL